MEERLAGEIKVTDDELRDLAQARAQAVRSALLESGQIPAERIFILAPKPINTAAQGETRANFSLE
jgi:outer membrane protein OmpA-like peptidoglycan-associated protein